METEQPNVMSEEDRIQESIQHLQTVLEEDDRPSAQALLRELHASEVATILESLPRRDRDAVWDLLDPKQHRDVLAEAEDEVRADHMESMHPAEIAAVAQDVDIDDAVDILQDLPEDVIAEVLEAMDDQHRARVESVLAYPEDTAGGLMDTDVLTVRADVTFEAVARYLRLKGRIPEKTNRLMVVDRDNIYQGTLRLALLLIHDPDTVVGDMMETTQRAIPATTAAHDVAVVFEQRGLISAPVVDTQDRLVGRITIDDVVDVIRDEADHSLMGLAGLDEEADMFAPVLTTARRRTLWLGLNLATALLASWVIGLFEATIQQVVALAILMPVVASMGGIAGSQALTVVIRGMALGQVGQSNAGSLMLKELAVGLINSILWAVVVAVVAVAWFGDVRLGVIVGVALIVNLVVAALAGASIPLILRRLLIDPALAGGVLLTTVTDVVGFVAFLGLGTAFLTEV